MNFSLTEMAGTLFLIICHSIVVNVKTRIHKSRVRSLDFLKISENATPASFRTSSIFFFIIADFEAWKRSRFFLYKHKLNGKVRGIRKVSYKYAYLENHIFRSHFEET